MRAVVVFASRATKDNEDLFRVELEAYHMDALSLTRENILDAVHAHLIRRYNSPRTCPRAHQPRRRPWPPYPCHHHIIFHRKVRYLPSASSLTWFSTTLCNRCCTSSTFAAFLREVTSSSASTFQSSSVDEAKVEKFVYGVRSNKTWYGVLAYLSR